MIRRLWHNWKQRRLYQLAYIHKRQFIMFSPERRFRNSDCNAIQKYLGWSSRRHFNSVSGDRSVPSGKKHQLSRSWPWRCPDTASPCLNGVNIAVGAAFYRIAHLHSPFSYTISKPRFESIEWYGILVYCLIAYNDNQRWVMLSLYT